MSNMLGHGYKLWKGVDGLIQIITSDFSIMSEQASKPPYCIRERHTQAQKAPRGPLGSSFCMQLGNLELFHKGQIFWEARPSNP